MKTIEENGIRHLYPKEGYFLRKDDIVTDYLILGVNDDGSDWSEITSEERDELLPSDTENEI